MQVSLSCPNRLLLVLVTVAAVMLATFLAFWYNWAQDAAVHTPQCTRTYDRSQAIAEARKNIGKGKEALRPLAEAMIQSCLTLSDLGVSSERLELDAKELVRLSVPQNRVPVNGGFYAIHPEMVEFGVIGLSIAQIEKVIAQIEKVDAMNQKHRLYLIWV